MYFEIDELHLGQHPLFLPVQPVNRLYSFITVFEASELTLILQGRSEYDSHMDDVLTLSFKLNSGSFNTIGECVYELSGESVQ